MELKILVFPFLLLAIGCSAISPQLCGDTVDQLENGIAVMETPEGWELRENVRNLREGQNSHGVPCDRHRKEKIRAKMVRLLSSQQELHP